MFVPFKMRKHMYSGEKGKKKNDAHFFPISSFVMNLPYSVNNMEDLLTEDREALHCQQKQDLEVTVAQTMRSLLENSGFN